MSNSKCNHKFKPRYSEKYPDFMNRIASLEGTHWPSMEKIYECDVCVKCGKTTKTKEKN